jgi:dipeptidyl aminopeptidase/acylaminoacyl peptidase
MKKIFIFILFIAFAFEINAQQRLTPELMWKFGRVSDAKLSPDGKTVLYGITYYDLVENTGNRDLYTVSVDGGNAVKITDTKSSEYNAIWRPDGKKIAFLSAESGSMQIWEMNTDGSGKNQISNFEGGINGFSYSPDIKNILFFSDVKLDTTANELYPDLPKANVRIIDNLMYRHWNTWSDFSYSHVFYAPYSDGNMGNATDIMPGERWDSPVKTDGGIEQITWSPDGSQIAYTSRKLYGKDYAESTNSDIYIYNLNTKQTYDLTEGMNGYDFNPVFSQDGKKIVWESMKTTGFESDKKRIMAYDFGNKQYTDLSSNFDQSSTNFKWSEDGKYIYFISGINATYQIYKIEVDSKKITQITKGVHDYTEFETAEGVIIGTRMSMSKPSEIYRVDEKTGNETEISLTNKDLLASLEMGKVEERWIKTTDNKQMLVWVIYPPGFDKNKKYPALLYCQGGPQSAVSQFFSFRWNFQIMAANDYIIVAPNRRGLPSFGQEWNDQISQDYGGQNMEDYLSAIDEVSNEPFINKDKLGAVGASYGGFSVYWLAGHHNKRFKAFIAHCGMFNFESWYGSTEEMWFANYDLGGPYWEKPQPRSYDFSPHKFVGKWDTPILVIEGQNDFRIPYTQGMEAFDAAQLQGIPSKFLFFPDETHFVTKPQNSVLWQREFFKWLDKWLK